MRLQPHEWSRDAPGHWEALRRYPAADHGDAGLVLDVAALRLSAAIDRVSHVPEESRCRLISDEGRGEKIGFLSYGWRLEGPALGGPAT